MAIRHVYSQTVADGTATSVVRPSDWNSAHNQTLFLAGNTAGVSSISGSDIYWAGGSNVTLSANGSTVSVIGVAAQTVDTNKAGTGFTSTTTAGTAVTAALGTNGLSMAVPQYITTYVNDLTSGRAGTGFTSTTTAGTAITAALGTNGLTMAVPQFLTTYAAQTVDTNKAGTGFTSTTTAGTAVTAALGTNGLSMAVPNFITTYVNDLTSGRAGTGFTSTTTAGTAVTAALGTNGLSMAVPNFITTYAAQTVDTNKAGTGTTTAATNISLTLGVNSNGVALSANVPDVDYDAWNLVGVNTAGTTGSTITTQGALYFSGGNNITLSGNSNTIVISAGAGGGTTNQTGPNIAVAGSTITSGTVLFSNANGITFGMAGSTITASASAFTASGYNHYNDVVQVAGQVGQGTLNFDPINLGFPVQFDRFGAAIYHTASNNSTGTQTVSMWVGLYTRNVSTLSLLGSTSTAIVNTQSGTVGNYSLYSGFRLLTIPFTTTLQPNDYWLGVISSTASGGANPSGAYSQMLQSNLGTNFVGLFGVATNTTQQYTLGQGVYSAATGALPSSVAFSQIRGSDSAAARPPVVGWYSGTV